MRFRTLLPSALLISLTLAACSSKEMTVTYTANFDTSDVSRTTVLGEAVQRVMVRKLSAMGMKNPRVIAVPKGNNAATVTFTLPDEEAREIVSTMTSERLTFDMRIEKEAPADGKNINLDNWIPTALTGAHLVWAQAIGDRSTGNISIDLEFTDEGTKILKDIFARKNAGKSLGIFVRDLLVSKLLIDETPTTNHFRIGGVPSENIAEVFADDLNVGLHTTFTLETK